jgi:branched-chain amino acid transport system ATP-binding protein
MLDVTNLSSCYGRIQALKNVDLTVGVGEIVILVGSNGAGKTTLLRTLSGVRPTSDGTISFRGKSITKEPPSTRVMLGLSQVPEGRQLFAPLSVEENLLLGAYVRKDREMAPDIERIYTMFPVLKERSAERSGNLSGGQQQMLAIGRALMARPKMLLLDEPSMGLAPNLVDQIFETLVALRNEGMTILLVEQNIRAALSIADRGYVMVNGAIAISGTASDLLENAEVQAAYLGI